MRVLPRLLGRFEKVLTSILFISLIASGAAMAQAMSSRYAVTVAAHGGTLREGIVGIPRFINPLLAVSDTDRDVISLVYTGLLRFDGKGNLIPSLAERYEILQEGREYVFYLREAEWSDGQSVTAEDIAFTIELAKNPAYRSPARANWEGITVEAVDKRTVRFTLAKPYAPFLENATLGILPRHLWKDILPAEFNLTELNLRPVGAGPYTVLGYEKNSSGRITLYHLQANKTYLPEEPFITYMDLKFYGSQTESVEALERGEIDSLSGLPPRFARSMHEQNRPVIQLSLPRIFGLFFNQNESKTLADAAVRSALELAADKAGLVEQVLENQGTPLYSPIPPDSFGALEASFYQDRAFNVEQAKALLTKAGWTLNTETGIREKKLSKTETLQLTFTISTSNTPDLIETARLLQTMWETIGAKVDLKVYEISDFERDILQPRKYAAILFGEVVGNDPDPFAFWHSSQRNDPGLNIALYTNPKADKLLEEARITPDITARKQKYEEFQKLIAEDNPAVFLYSPYYLYVPARINNVRIERIVLPEDRFGSVQEWHMQTRNTWKLFK